MSTKTITDLRQELQYKIDTKTKPPGSLGKLEEIALQVGMIQQTSKPCITHPHIVVFAADHGITATGLVNPYPQAVTAQMVFNFIHGGAAINVFCRQHNIQLRIVDAGVNADFNDLTTHRQFIDAKIGYGTRNYLEEQAMSEKEAGSAIKKGREIVEAIHSGGCNCIGFGEMGIGNTSSASLIMSVVTSLPVDQCVGRGTGTNEEQLSKKIKTLEQVHKKHKNFVGLSISAMRILQAFGGFEIAMMTGAFLEAAERRMVIVVDGFICTAALLLAHMIDHRVLSNCIFAHTSGEQGHEKMLRYLHAQPLLDLKMRLGEGTGAALAIPLIQSALNFLEEMASFESAGINDKE